MATVEERLAEIEALNAQEFVSPGSTAPADPLVSLPSPTLDPITGGTVSDPNSVNAGVDPALPTPSAPTIDPLEAKIREVSDTIMKDQTPISVQLPDPKQNSAMNFLGGFNKRVAETLGIPADLANEVMAVVGLKMYVSAKDLRGETSGLRQGTEDVKAAFRAAGINVDPLDGLMKEMGEATFTSLAGYAALLRAAPAMAARTGQGVVDTVMRTVGDAIQKHPWLAGIEEVGAGLGSVLGEGVTKGSGAIKETLGTMGGAVAGSVTAGGITRRVQGAGQKIANLFTGTPAPKTAIRDPNADPTDATTFAVTQLEGDLRTIQNAIDGALATVSPNTPAHVAQARLRTGLEKAEELGRQIEGKFWDRVPLQEPVPMTPIRRNIEQMEADLNASNRFGANVPRDEMEALKDIGRPKRGKDGKMYKDLPTVEQLRNKSREFKHKARVMESSDAPDTQGISYLKRLSGIIDDGIARALPNDPSITQAREFSIKFNDMFSRGPIAEVLRARRSGADFVPPGMTAEALLKKFEGVESVQNMQRELRTIRDPADRRRFALSRPDRDDLRELEGQMEQSVRAMFTEAAGGDPAAAAKFVSKWEDGIKPLASTAAQLKRVVDVTQALTLDAEEISKSALAKFSQRDGQKAISNLWNAQSPVNAVRNVRAGLSADPDALKGLSAGLIDELWRRGGGNVSGMANVMNDTATRKMLEVGVDKGTLARLDRIVSIARKFEEGDAKTLRQVVAPGASVLARIIGAHLGRSIAPGQLQAPSIMSQNAMRLAEAIFGSTPADTMLRMAINDPKWEKILLQRLPSNTKEMKRMAHFIGAQVGTQETVMGLMENE
jgi:hypothetical protein